MRDTVRIRGVVATQTAVAIVGTAEAQERRRQQAKVPASKEASGFRTPPRDKAPENASGIRTPSRDKKAAPIEEPATPRRMPAKVPQLRPVPPASPPPARVTGAISAVAVASRAAAVKVSSPKADKSRPRSVVKEGAAVQVPVVAKKSEPPVRPPVRQPAPADIRAKGAIEPEDAEDTEPEEDEEGELSEYTSYSCEYYHSECDGPVPGATAGVEKGRAADRRSKPLPLPTVHPVVLDYSSDVHRHFVPKVAEAIETPDMTEAEEGLVRAIDLQNSSTSPFPVFLKIQASNRNILAIWHSRTVAVPSVSSPAAVVCGMAVLAPAPSAAFGHAAGTMCRSTAVSAA